MNIKDITEEELADLFDEEFETFLEVIKEINAGNIELIQGR